MVGDQLETDVLLVVQQDMPFVRPIDMGVLGELLQTNRQVRHIRFNLRANEARGWDAIGHNLVGLGRSRKIFFARCASILRVDESLACKPSAGQRTTRSPQPII